MWSLPISELSDHQENRYGRCHTSYAHALVLIVVEGCDIGDNYSGLLTGT